MTSGVGNSLALENKVLIDVPRIFSPEHNISLDQELLDKSIKGLIAIFDEILPHYVSMWTFSKAHRMFCIIICSYSYS